MSEFLHKLFTIILTKITDIHMYCQLIINMEKGLSLYKEAETEEMLFWIGIKTELWRSY